MKKIIFLIAVFSFLISCKNDPFFNNFDKVEHYHLKNKSLLNYETRDSVSAKIMNEDYPDNLNDNEFYKRINQNFSIKEFANLDVVEFKKIFNKNTFTDFYTTACVPDFNDILILKKENKIVGIVKICLGCQMHYIIGRNELNKKIESSGGIENEEIKFLLNKNLNKSISYIKQ